MDRAIGVACEVPDVVASSVRGLSCDGLRWWAAAVGASIGFLRAFVFFAFSSTLISLITTGAVLGRALPDGVPLWVAAVSLVVAFELARMPLSAVRRFWYRAARGAVFQGHLIELLLTLFVAWRFYEREPEVRDFIARVPTLVEPLFR